MTNDKKKKQEPRKGKLPAPQRAVSNQNKQENHSTVPSVISFRFGWELNSPSGFDLRPCLTWNLSCWLHTDHKLAEGSKVLGKNMCDPHVFTSPGEQVQTLTLLNAPIFSALKGIYIALRRCSPQEVITKTITVPSRQSQGKQWC